jgi:ribosome biogenesis GTPase
MIQLPSGALVIDTPGLRELGLWESADGVEATFEDVETISTRCRFTNCRHENEPGCAVQQAIDNGEMEAARLAGYHKLVKEQAHFARLQNARAQAEERRRIKSATKQMRKFHQGED